MPSRRDYLAAAAAALVSLAGCQSDTEPSDATTTAASPGTDAATTTAQTAASTTESDDVLVEDVVVRKAVRYESAMGSSGVLAGDDEQYVVATVQADRELAASAFEFATDGESWTPGLPDTAGGVNRSVAGHGGGPVGRPVGDDAISYLAFTVPSPLSVSNPRIEYGTNDAATWPLPSPASETLAAPAPEFELRTLDLPESVTRGDPLSVSLTAANVSETSGRFLAALYWPTTVADDDESHVVEREVDAGDTVPVSRTIPTEHTEGDGAATLRVRGHVTAERDVDLETT